MHEIQVQLTYMLMIVSVYVIYYFVLVLINGQWNLHNCSHLQAKLTHFHVSHLKPCHASVASHPVFAILLHMLASTVFSVMMSFGRGSVRIFGFLFSALALFLFSSALIIPYKINPMWLSIQNSWHFIAIHISSGWVELCSKSSWLIRIHTII
jgi:hypothetical protein